MSDIAKDRQHWSDALDRQWAAAIEEARRVLDSAESRDGSRCRRSMLYLAQVLALIDQSNGALEALKVVSGE